MTHVSRAAHVDGDGRTFKSSPKERMIFNSTGAALSNSDGSRGKNKIARQIQCFDCFGSVDDKVYHNEYKQRKSCRAIMIIDEK